MPHLPILRAGRPYKSLTVSTLHDVASGEPVAEVSQANSGLIAKDLGHSAENRRALEALSVADLVRISRRAARLFAEEDLPCGDDSQSPEEYVRQLSATTGLPQTLARANMKKAGFVLSEMETVLGGLTRGLDPGILDAGWGQQDNRVVSYRRETDVLGAVLPSNSPGVHSLWLPALPLKVTLALKPGSQEPWTPFRLAQALIAAGCPPEAFGFYPTDYSGANEILLRSGRSLLYGDRATVAPWESDPRVQIHGPGWSKVVLGSDYTAEWRDHIDLLVSSIADNGGRSCINASGIRVPSHGREIAEALASRLAQIEALPLDHPDARLAAFPNRAAAERLSAHIDSRLEIPGAEDVTARFRSGGRVAEAGGCAFVLPTLVFCEDPSHPLAQSEFLFPFASIVESPPEELASKIGPSLVVTALTDDPVLRSELLISTDVERLNLGPVPTSHVAWDQPHEGNLFEHLYRQRAFQAAGSSLGVETLTGSPP